MADRIVVDSSVLIKWVKMRDEQLVEEARRLLTRVEARPLEVHVPALLLYEVGNVLLLKTRLGIRALERIFDYLESLPLIVAPPATPLLKRAAGLGRRFGITFYDAAFPALAIELGCPFVTADERLFGRIRALPGAYHLSQISSLA